MGPVVNSCSPEGHLPMDFEPGMFFDLGDSRSCS